MHDFQKKDIIIGLIILMIIVAIALAYVFLSKKEENNYEFLKDYNINEYIPTYISDEEMAKIYLNDYINKLYSNIGEAYYLLDEEYRNEKFGNIVNFKNYISSKDYSSYGVNEYYREESDGFIYIGVYDYSGDVYIFKTNGVMQYSVYLDDYTVEIW